MTKVCTNKECLLEKDISEFSKNKKNKDGLSCWCKDCHKKHYNQNKDTFKENFKKYHQENREKILEEQKEYRQGNKETVSKCKKLWYAKNRDRILEQRKEYRKQNLDKMREYDKERFQRKKDIYRVLRREYKKKRRSVDTGFKLRENVSHSVYMALKNNGAFKRDSCLSFFPFTIQELKEHLEKQFEPWMCWENHGNYNPNVLTWQIDHIIPHSSFKYATMDCDEFRDCWSLHNLRPLKSIDNIKKGNR